MFSRRFLVDLAERVVWTSVQAFAASLLVTGLDDIRSALAIAGGAAVISIAKCVLATKVGDSESAAAIPGA